MRRRRHTPEQIIRKLRGRRMIGEGKTIPEAAKAIEISEQTYHRWRNQRRDEWVSGRLGGDQRAALAA